MSFLRKTLRSLVIPEGRYTYRGKGEFVGMALQLRIQADGRGVMVINANTDVNYYIKLAKRLANISEDIFVEIKKK